MVSIKKEKSVKILTLVTYVNAALHSSNVKLQTKQLSLINVLESNDIYHRMLHEYTKFQKYNNENGKHRIEQVRSGCIDFRRFIPVKTVLQFPNYIIH